MINKDLSEFGDDVFSTPINSERITKYVYRLYQRASLSGILDELNIAEVAINEAIKQIGPADDLYYLKANLDFKLHRLAAVKDDIKNSRSLGESPQARILFADIAFQEGRHDDAKGEYENLIKEDLTWDNLCRLAYFHFKTGDIERAEQLYVEAEDELTAKEMRHYAWVELQRGILDLRQGRYEDALAHYETAGKAYSGYWLVDDHKAEVLAAQGKTDEAVALYESVVERVPRADFQQVLGELYEFSNQPDKAEACYEKAFEGYMESVERGDVHYFHHLTDFYADIRKDGAEAVKWARKDIEFRKNYSTLAALAWALYRDGKFSEALETMQESLASGAKDAHLFSQAAKIYQANGKDAESNYYLQLTAEMNPRFRDFHMHR